MFQLTADRQILEIVRVSNSVDPIWNSKRILRADLSMDKVEVRFCWYMSPEIPECKFAMTEGSDMYTIATPPPPPPQVFNNYKNKFLILNCSFLLTWSIVCLKKKTGAWLGKTLESLTNIWLLTRQDKMITDIFWRHWLSIGDKLRDSHWVYTRTLIKTSKNCKPWLALHADRWMVTREVLK